MQNLSLSPKKPTRRCAFKQGIWAPHVPAGIPQRDFRTLDHPKRPAEHSKTLLSRPLFIQGPSAPGIAGRCL